MARLLDVLREVGGEGQAAALASRVAAHAPLDSPGNVASLLNGLREAGAEEQAAVLAKRLRETGMFGPFLERGGQDQLRFGQEADGSPTGPWGWDDLE